MALSNRAPDWDWWRHVPTVTLREAVALSLELDPNWRRELPDSYERQSFEKRLALANRCLGDTLHGPLNFAAWHYLGVEPVVRLADFAAWAVGVGLEVPPALAKLVRTAERLARDAEPQAPNAPKRGGRSARPANHPPSREKPFWPAARPIAFKWLIENGCPTSGDGNQAILEKLVAKWLEDRGHDASESTLRRHVRQWIEERRAELNAEVHRGRRGQ